MFKLDYILVPSIHMIGRIHFKNICGVDILLESRPLNATMQLAIHSKTSDLPVYATCHLLGMDEWIWQYQELYPDQLRVVKRLRQTEEIYSPQVAVKD